MSKENIKKLTKELYPTGRAFNLIEESLPYKLHCALSESENKALEDSLALLDHILPDNDNFLEDDAAIWEERLGLIVNPSSTLADRKLSILRKLNYPGTIRARQSLDFIQDQLNAAGFSVNVYANDPAQSIYDLLFSKAPFQLGVSQLADDQLAGSANVGSLFEVFQLGTNQLGDFQLNSFLYKNKIANNIDADKDAFYPLLSNFERTFIIAGADACTFTSVPLARKNEFRELILKLKPVESIGYLLINYV